MEDFDKTETILGQSSREKLLSQSQDEDQIVYVRQKRSRWSLFRSWFGSFALGAICASMIIGAWSKYGSIPKEPSYRFADTDAIADVPYEQILFQADPLYSERPSDDTDYAWNLLLPPGRGFVYVPDSEQRGLPPGQKVDHGEIYSVAMYHQLHCLARIRKMHWVFKDAVATGEMGMAKSFAGRTTTDHVQHCLDYIRQSILCNGDMTLEWPKLDGPSSGVRVTGWDIPHTCKSRSAIKDYMDKYHFNESIAFDAAG